MDVSICPLLVDLEAPLMVPRLHDTSDLDTVKRRVSRTATLDLDASFYDTGYTPADRTLTVSVAVTGRTDPKVALARKFVKFYAELIVSIHEDIFLGVIQQIFLRNDVLTMSIMLKRSLS